MFTCYNNYTAIKYINIYAVIHVFYPLLLFSRSVLSVLSVLSSSLRPHGLQHSRLLCPSLPELAQTHVHGVDDAIQPSCPLLTPSPPSIRVFSDESACPSGGQSVGASASAYPYICI